MSGRAGRLLAAAALAAGIACGAGTRQPSVPPATSSPEQQVAHLLCLPDGRLVAAGFGTGLLVWDPATGSSPSIRSGALLPSDGIQRIELDRMVKPEALHVSTSAGAAVIRPIPGP
jgi:hypothetical protein